MKPRFHSLPLAALAFTAASFAADEPEQKPPPSAHDVLNALVRAEAAKKQAAHGTTNTPAPAAVAPKTDVAASAAAPATDKSKDAKPEINPLAKDPNAKPEIDSAKSEPATVLPKVEVRRGRINEIDGQIIEQEKQIAHEKENAKPTETDKALNNEKVSKALSIFGGQSSQQRATVTSERVQIMEEERDLLEAMKSAKTKAEKAELQKQIDELRAYRRELEKSLR